MRKFAFVPIFLITAALVLNFLCLFAGSSPSFLSDFQILTLNVSQIGQQSFLTATDGDSNIQNLFNALPEDIQAAIALGVNSAAQSLGIPEFYNAHIMTWCDGSYTPTNVPAGSIDEGDINKDVESCTSMQAGYRLDPRDQVQQSLDDAGLNIDVAELGWPQALDDALDLVEPITLAAFILIVVNCVLIFGSWLSAVIALFRIGKWSACCTLTFNLLAVLVSAATSAILTVLYVYGPDLINEYGEDFGVQAEGGRNLEVGEETWGGAGEEAEEVED
jgi:hypothetical protein